MTKLVRNNPGTLAPTTMGEAMQFADMVSQSDFCPRDYKGKPGNIIVAMQMGSELGLAPMQSLQNIAVINGRPSVWGDAMLALVQSHPDCEDVKEWVDDGAAYCEIKRRGRSPCVRTFSIEDAKRARLWGKQGPWQQYPDRMLQMRARGFALRDAFADVLRGLITAEEAADIPVDKPAQKQKYAEPVQAVVVDAVVDEPEHSDHLRNLLIAIDAAETPEDLARVVGAAKQLDDSEKAVAREAFARAKREIEDRELVANDEVDREIAESELV